MTKAMLCVMPEITEPSLDGRRVNTRDIIFDFKEDYMTTEALWCDTILRLPVNAKPEQSGAIIVYQDLVGGRKLTLEDGWKTCSDFKIGMKPGQVTLLTFSIHNAEPMMTAAITREIADWIEARIAAS